MRQSRWVGCGAGLEGNIGLRAKEKMALRDSGTVRALSESTQTSRRIENLLVFFRLSVHTMRA